MVGAINVKLSLNFITPNGRTFENGLKISSF